MFGKKGRSAYLRGAVIAHGAERSLRFEKGWGKWQEIVGVERGEERQKGEVQRKRGGKFLMTVLKKMYCQPRNQRGGNVLRVQDGRRGLSRFFAKGLQKNNERGTLGEGEEVELAVLGNPSRGDSEYGRLKEKGSGGSLQKEQ